MYIGIIKQILWHKGKSFTNSEDGTIKVWNNRWEEEKVIELETPIKEIQVSLFMSLI